MFLFGMYVLNHECRVKPIRNLVGAVPCFTLPYSKDIY